ncbi:MAG: nucleotide exchange factor GrpE [Gemmatimonadetes bacterium]|nr:nucleotide exchange factor GrpE [Gemmatimonadota bacterium]
MRSGTDPVDGGVGAGAGEAELAGESALLAASTAQLAALQSELAALNDRHLRLAAEFDNYRKRLDRERAELWVRAQADLVSRLLDVLDDLQRYAEQSAEPASVDALLEAARLVEKKLRHLLESAGLEPIEAQGEFFNPATMEAVMTAPAEDAEEDEVVAEVFQRGYRFRDVLIRPARVQVKKHQA